MKEGKYMGWILLSILYLLGLSAIVWHMFDDFMFHMRYHRKQYHHYPVHHHTL